MKVFILSPNADIYFTQDVRKTLAKVGEVEYLTEIKSLTKVKCLFEGDEDRILAIDPDFCDWKFGADIIAKIPKLKAICIQSTSFSWIDTEFARKMKIPVMNVRLYSTNSVAEWAVMIALNVARKIPIVIKEGWKYDFGKHQGMELEGKTAGIIGLGNIGTRIAEICKGMGMNVIYWSRKSRDKRFNFTSLGKLMKSADCIFPAVAQNEETQGLITDKMLKSMKESAIFVSIVHAVYNNDLLLKMVEKGKIYGYAFEEDKVDFNKYKGNVWAGPPLAWATKESMRRNIEIWVDNIVKATKGKYPAKVN